MSGNDEDPEPLEDELVRAAKRPARSFFKQSGDQDETNNPVLVRIVKAVEGEQAWRHSPNQAFLRVLRQAIDLLPEAMSDRTPRGEDLRHGPWQGSPERRMAEILYGFRDPEIPRRRDEQDHELPLAYQDYVSAALTLATTTNKRYRGRITKVIREDLADVLLALERQAISRREQAATAPAPATGQDTSPAADPDLIPRDQCVLAVATQIVHEGRRHCNCVCIWGEPGTGKTVLANQVAQALNRGPVARLRAGNPDVLQDDLSAFFIAESIEPGNWNESDRRAQFKYRLSASNPQRLTAKFAIIDNVDDEDLIDQLVPPDPRVPILLTMRYRPSASRVKHVELADFSEAEACTFIRRHLGDIDALPLARVLGCRPLALDHAVRFIRKAPDITLRELVQDLTADLQMNLALVTPPEQRERNLIQLYKLILASLADDQSALDVLRAFLAIAGKSGIEHRGSVLLLMLRHPREPHNRLYYYAGLRSLARLGLLREEADPGDAEHVLLVMHPLTYRIVRDLEAPVIFRIEADYLNMLDNLEIDDLEPRQEMRRAAALARLRAWAGQVGRHVGLPGYVYFSAIDEETWIAVREAPDEHGIMQPYTVRYEVYPDQFQFYKLDYRDGKRSRLNRAEVDQLSSLISAHFHAVMPELNRNLYQIQVQPVQAYVGQLDSIATFFERVFTEPPFGWGEEDRNRHRQILTLVARMPPTFSALAVATDHQEQLHGAAYGHAIFPSLNWWDNLEEPLPPEQIAAWSQDTFVLQQVAVVSTSRHQGIGRRLIEDLLRGRTEQRATVRIPKIASESLVFFTTLGWRHVGQKTVRMSGLPVPHDILVSELLHGNSVSNTTVSKLSYAGFLDGPRDEQVPYDGSSRFALPQAATLQLLYQRYEGRPRRTLWPVRHRQL